MAKINFINTLVWKDGKYYVAQSVGLNIASQGKTKSEALKNLQEALELYFEDVPSPEPFISALPQHPTLTQIAI